MSASKWIHEPFANFFEHPTRETLAKLLKTSAGEFREFDFKESWPDGSDLARHILALANGGGGCIILGMRETGNQLEPVGLPELLDKTKAIDRFKKYVPARLIEYLNIMDFNYSEAENPSLAKKLFQVVFVEGLSSALPFIATADGSGIRTSAIYIRRGPSSVEINDAELEKLLSKRSQDEETKPARDLKEHLAELEVLYSKIPKTIFTPHDSLRLSFEGLLGMTKANPRYPKESYDDFLLRLLERKKSLINSMLGFK